MSVFFASHSNDLRRARGTIEAMRADCLYLNQMRIFFQDYIKQLDRREDACELQIERVQKNLAS